MLTIIAWCAFVMASIWNIAILAAVIALLAESKKVFTLRNTFQLIVSFAVWMIPGIYLFGWN